MSVDESVTAIGLHFVWTLDDTFEENPEVEPPSNMW